MMAPIYKVAIIQTHPKVFHQAPILSPLVTPPVSFQSPLTLPSLQPMQIAQNHQKAADYIAIAAAQGAQLAVLPEYHLTNWVPEDPGFVGLCAQWKTYLDKYRALAKKHNICIVPGTIVEHHKDAETEEEKLINVAYFISNGGEVLGSYQKKNLWYRPNTYLPIFLG